jgi:hypothetical protein
VKADPVAGKRGKALDEVDEIFEYTLTFAKKASTFERPGGAAGGTGFTGALGLTVPGEQKCPGGAGGGGNKGLHGAGPRSNAKENEGMPPEGEMAKFHLKQFGENDFVSYEGRYPVIFS